MTSNKPEPNSTTSNALGFDYSDIANYEKFMEALEAFMNESAMCIQQVKMRSGLSPGCGAPVKMNSEERQTKMNEILHSLAEKFKEEKKNEEAQRAAAARANPNATYMAPQQMRPPPYPSAAPSDCPCAPYRKGGRRGDSARPVTSPARGRMQASDSYYMPSSQSAMSSQYGECSCPSTSMGRSSRRRY